MSSKAVDFWDPYKSKVISGELIEVIQQDGNYVLTVQPGSIHFYIFCPTHESLTALHRKKDIGTLENQFRDVLEIHCPDIGHIDLELDLVDDRPLQGMQRSQFHNL